MATEQAAEQAEQNGDKAEKALERRDSRGSSVLVPARYGFADEQVEAIKRTVAKDATDAELVMFLEVCARYDLDPFAKQVYAAKIRGAMQIIVSRDGLLAHAHKQPDFRGIIGDVVRAGDAFTVTYKDGKRGIEHSYGTQVTASQPEGQQTGRGDIVGAWAEVRREGHEPTFYFAYLSEYNRGGDTPWAKQTSAMILKVAETYALRKAYSVSGVVGEEEIERERTNLTAPTEEGDYGDDPVLAERLQTALKQAREIDGAKWRPARMRAVLDGATHEDRLKLADELELFIEAHPLQGEVVQSS
jgi:phage recombination protein Bet